MKQILLTLSILLFLSCKNDKPIEPINTGETLVNADTVKFNQLQWIGSHNSYRTMTDPDVYNRLKTLGGVLPANLDIKELDYTHLPLSTQFDDYGMRSIELDIYHDPQGGLFYNRAANTLAGKSTASNVPELNQPGFKLIHIADVDYNTHHYTFKSSLEALKSWSDANPTHFPIVVLIETKKDGLPNNLGIPVAVPLAFNQNAMDSIDLEIESVFNNTNQLITPDFVRGTESTLEQAVLTKGWPRLNEVKGKVMFILNATSDEKTLYSNNHANLMGRKCFIFGSEGNPETACILMDDAIGKETQIQDLVKKGYLIRTRSDAGTIESRNGDTRTLNSALNSGGQIISTDYYKADARFSNYVAKLPDSAWVRLNPINGPKGKLSSPIK